MVLTDGLNLRHEVADSLAKRFRFVRRNSSRELFPRPLRGLDQAGDPYPLHLASAERRKLRQQLLRLARQPLELPPQLFRRLTLNRDEKRIGGLRRGQASVGRHLP